MYYGPASPQAVSTLGGFDVVVLHPTLYAAADLQALREGGTRVLAYLSVGEDHTFGDLECVTGSAPYHCAVNAEWGSVVVDAAHPGWRAVLLARAEQVLEHTDGLLLDTLDSADPAATLDLVGVLRAAAPGAMLMANRGFGLLPGLVPLVQSVLFEAFSTTHSPRLAAHNKQGLAYTAHWLGVVKAAGLPVVALDYAAKPKLIALARARAAHYAVPTFVTNRALTLPGGL
ncbi:endo alpha-1,4 polygalactosaminidase [Deinococcus sp. QL22]|uniref:endo alpha-1,4 polygalactosaminidase n=1 Tax=Deinococcus sp. QL22 TaxID=2939437 RepID=UPI002016FD58|nr:endo alpha-1,4 polygalactosaminidase [Deinococcus sp. QL22]UQN05969.1 endo alpha-1,4 polygalactosaminidase [Deinococcus sp. QL22]